MQELRETSKATISRFLEILSVSAYTTAYYLLLYRFHVETVWLVISLINCELRISGHPESHLFDPVETSLPKCPRHGLKVIGKKMFAALMEDVIDDVHGCVDVARQIVTVPAQLVPISGIVRNISLQEPARIWHYNSQNASGPQDTIPILQNYRDI
jgi:hypothetical protein